MLSFESYFLMNPSLSYDSSRFIQFTNGRIFHIYCCAHTNVRRQCLEAHFFLTKFQIVAQELLIFKKIENIVFVIYNYLIPFKNLCCSKKFDINLPTNNFKFFPKSYFWNFCSFSCSVYSAFSATYQNHFTCSINVKCRVDEKKLIRCLVTLILDKTYFQNYCNRTCLKKFGI